MKSVLFSLLLVAFIFRPLFAAQDELPPEAQAVIVKASVKLEAAKRAYDETVTKIHVTEAKELQRVYDNLKKGSSPATAVKEVIDSLAVGKVSASVWVLGKWVVSKDNYRAVWEFKPGTVTQGPSVNSQVELKGKWFVEGEEIQIIWANQSVETFKVPDPLGDTTTMMSRAGPMTATRAK